MRYVTVILSAVLLVALFIAWGMGYQLYVASKMKPRRIVQPEDIAVLEKVLSNVVLGLTRIEQIEVDNSPYRASGYLGVVLRASPSAYDALAGTCGWVAKDGFFDDAPRGIPAINSMHLVALWFRRVAGNDIDKYEQYLEKITSVSVEESPVGKPPTRVSRWVRSVAVCDTATSPDLKVYVMTDNIWYRPDLRVLSK